MTMHCLVRLWAASFLLLAVLVSETLSIDEGMEKFIGRWQPVSVDNYGAFMTEIGSHIFRTNTFESYKPSIIFSAEPDGSYKIRSVSTSKYMPNTEINFRLNEEINLFSLVDGRETKSTFRLEDGKLVEYQRADVNSVITRELTDYNTLVASYMANDVTATRVWTRE